MCSDGHVEQGECGTTWGTTLCRGEDRKALLDNASFRPLSRSDGSEKIDSCDLLVFADAFVSPRMPWALTACPLCCREKGLWGLLDSAAFLAHISCRVTKGVCVHCIPLSTHMRFHTARTLPLWEHGQQVRVERRLKVDNTVRASI